MSPTAEFDSMESTTSSHVEEAFRSGLQPVISSAQARGSWISVVSHLDPRYGGLSAAVPELGSAIAHMGSRSIKLAAFCTHGESHVLSGHPLLDISYWPTARISWFMDAGLRARFRREMEQAEGVHIHGLWEQSTAIAARTATALRKPYIVSAHGMLEPWALRNRRFKKQIYAALIERTNLDGARCLHALTSAEAGDYRRFGCRAPIAVIPNGVRVPDALSPELFFQDYPELRHKRLLLFLGRLHPKKGLDLLIESWSTLASQWPDAHLVLAGPDFEDTRAPLEQRIKGLGLTTQVSFTGMLSGEHKWSALAAAECFLLPSYSEGLSVSVLEAMGSGVPVIVSEQCNLPEVKTAEAGWIVQSNVKSLTYGIREMLLNSSETNKQIGAKGSKLVGERFTWTRVASQMSALYDWARGGSLSQHVDLRVN